MNRLLFLTILFFLLSPRTLFALGVSPAIIEVPYLKPESTYHSSFIVSRADDLEELLIINIVKQGEGAEYVNFERKQIILEPGIKSVEVPFAISPVGARLGDYKTTVEFIMDQSSVEGQVLNFGIQVQLNFSVIDKQVVSFSLYDLRAISGHRGELIDLPFSINNIGNTPVKLDKVELTINGKTRTLTTANLPEFPAFSKKKASVSFRTFLRPGKYNYNISFFRQGKEVYHQEGLVLEVLPFSRKQKVIFILGITVILILIVWGSRYFLKSNFYKSRQVK